MPEPERAVPVKRLAGMVRRHGRHEIGIHDSALYEVDPAVLTEAVLIQEVLRPPQIGAPKHLLAVHALVCEVVDRVTDRLIRQCGSKLLV